VVQAGQIPLASITTPIANRLRQKLLRWYRQNARDLPWRRTRDPYAILVAEFMLQQTRVQTVIPYYTRFLELFPTVEALARAPEEEVLRAWSGLGYYQRARNLQRAALVIAHTGFPRSFRALRRLPGVGHYTAGAIASIAFGEPHLALDGNAQRVFHRLLGWSQDGASGLSVKRLERAVEPLLDRRDPGIFNQAVMELGATVCLPRQPRCPACPWAGECAAHRAGLADELNQAGKVNRPVEVYQRLLVVERGERFLMRQRPPGGRLAGFWELPEQAALPKARLLELIGRFSHSITRYRYRVEVFRASVRGTPEGFHWIPRERLPAIPVSTMSRKALARFLDTGTRVG